jgi:hypothetical protein
MWAMQQGSEARFGAGYNVLPVWKQRLNAKTLVTTPNSDVIYAMGYVDLGQDGPLVIEVPPGQQGILDDFWQRPVPGPTIDAHAFAGDVGFAGPDRGEGGKYLLLPPGYDRVLACLFHRSQKLAEPVALIERTRIYPLGKKDSAKPMQFPDASNVPVNMLFPPGRQLFSDPLAVHRQRSRGNGQCRLARHAGRHRHYQGPAVRAGRVHQGNSR